MVTREQIEQAKHRRDRAFFQQVLDTRQSVRNLLQVLERLGRLPADFDPAPLLPLMEHPSPEVRLAAIKGLSRLENPDLLPLFTERVQRESNTYVRRELVSAIGRLRLPDAIPFLCRLLHDPDPKVVLQVIRALLCFRQRPEVQAALQPLTDHPNELVRAAVRKAFQPVQTSPSKQPHPASPDWLKNLMVCADVLDMLAHIPSESIHLTFTSPPYYNARDYTLYPSYEAYLGFLERVFREVHRITKEGRFFILNTSPVLIPRMSRQHSSKRYAIPFDIHPRLIEIGFEFVDDIIWVKPPGSAKNRNGGFFQHRKPLAYKANSVVEYVMVYRKATDKLIDWNIRQYDPAIVESSRVVGDYEPTNVWEIAPASDPVHPAVFPLELATRVIQLYSYKGDLVLDPFAGRGTIGQAALLTERYFLLAEKEPIYFEYARELLSAGNLLTNHTPRFLHYEEFVQLAKEQDQPQCVGQERQVFC
jgi:DNA modification methylase